MDGIDLMCPFLSEIYPYNPQMSIIVTIGFFFFFLQLVTWGWIFSNLYKGWGACMSGVAWLYPHNW